MLCYKEHNEHRLTTRTVVVYTKKTQVHGGSWFYVTKNIMNIAYPFGQWWCTQRRPRYMGAAGVTKNIMNIALPLGNWWCTQRRPRYMGAAGVTKNIMNIALPLGQWWCTQRRPRYTRAAGVTMNIALPLGHWRCTEKGRPRYTRAAVVTMNIAYREIDPQPGQTVFVLKRTAERVLIGNKGNLAMGSDRADRGHAVLGRCFLFA